MRAMRALGVQIEQTAPQESACMASAARSARRSHALDMGNSGTAMRLMTACWRAALRQRADRRLLADEAADGARRDTAAQMGARIEHASGKPPVRIRAAQRSRHSLRAAGGQRAGEIGGAARRSVCARPTTVIEPAVTRDHTERMLLELRLPRRCGARRSASDAAAAPEACSLEVPGDFSSSAFFMVAGSIGTAMLTISGVGINPTRTGLLDILGLMGADLRVVNHRSAGAEPVADIEVRPAALQGIHVPEHLVPLAIDEFPALFIAAALRRGRDGRDRRGRAARQRERSHRGDGRRPERNGVACEVLPDGIRIQGRQEPRVFAGGTVDSHCDPSIAMTSSQSPVQQLAGGRIRILDRGQLPATLVSDFPGWPGQRLQCSDQSVVLRAQSSPSTGERLR
jgi:5-enolpyruvylshikimate-3-phosphate synthase